VVRCGSPAGMQGCRFFYGLLGAGQRGREALPGGNQLVFIVAVGAGFEFIVGFQPGECAVDAFAEGDGLAGVGGVALELAVVKDGRPGEYLPCAVCHLGGGFMEYVGGDMDGGECAARYFRCLAVQLVPCHPFVAGDVVDLTQAFGVLHDGHKAARHVVNMA